jgi:hypothetical protein
MIGIERINTTSSRSGRVDDTEVTRKARFAGRRSSSKCGGRDETDGQPEGRECEMQSSQRSPRKRCDIDNGRYWAQPESGRIESTEPMGIERDRWASREAEVSGSERVNHFSSGLDAIRESRIACKVHEFDFSRFRLLAERALAPCRERAYTGAMRTASQEK